MTATTRLQIAIGLFGIALVVSMLLIFRALEHQSQVEIPAAVPTPTMELSDIWSTALADRLRDAMDTWDTCRHETTAPITDCFYTTIAAADSILGDLEGHQPYSFWGAPLEGTACWQRLNQLRSVAQYMARLQNDADFIMATLHMGIAMRYSCVGVLP